jgi:hypothetical protein
MNIYKHRHVENLKPMWSDLSRGYASTTGCGSSTCSVIRLSDSGISVVCFSITAREKGAALLWRTLL